MNESETRRSKRQRGHGGEAIPVGQNLVEDHERYSESSSLQINATMNETTIKTLFSKYQQLEQLLAQKDAHIKELENEIVRLKEEVRIYFSFLLNENHKILFFSLRKENAESRSR
jgi:predicted RNase H-like nuclease (RuvC/YqgF family)